MAKTKDPFETAIRILTAREHSSFQLRVKLKKREFTESEIVQTLTKLVELSYLDDLRFARLLIRYRVLRKLRGFADASQKLYFAKVGNEIMEQALSEAREEISEREVCMEAALKKQESLHEINRRKRFEKIARHLAGRGFPAQMIREIVNEILNTEEV